LHKIVLVAAALALAAGPAHAGPVAAAVAWVGSAIAGGGALGFIVQMAVSTGLSLLAQAIAGKPRRPEVSVQFEVQLGDDHPLTFVAGDYVTAGKRKYLGSWGKSTRYITEVIEVSALPQGFDGLWVDDEPGEFHSHDRVWKLNPSVAPGSVSDQAEMAPGSNPSWLLVGRPLRNYADDGNRIYVKWVDGTQLAADPFLVRIFGADPDYPWTAAMVGRGKSYAIITTRYDSETLQNYPAYLLKPAPLAMYDLRFDSTNGGSGPQRWDDPATWQPTRNPAVIAYNLIRGVYFQGEWVFGGRNLPAWRLPSAEWIAAANECDAPVPLAGGGSEPAWRCGMEISVDMTGADVLEEIGRASNMRFAEVGGQIKPIVGLPGAAVFSFTDDDIIITEGQSFRPFAPVSETYNAISATYPEPAEKWATKDSPEYVDAAATAEDGGRYLPTGVSYSAAPYAQQVQRLQRSQLQDYRRMRRHQFHLPPEAYAIEPGVDLVSWTSRRNGYVSKLFLVESVAKTRGMNVLVSLREVDPGDYDWDSGFEFPVTITPPVNPLPYVQPVPGFAVSETSVRDGAGQPRRAAILVQCDPDEAGITEIHVEARVKGEPVTISAAFAYAPPHGWYLRDVLPRTTYEVRARLLSDLTPVSEWSPWHQVTTLDITVQLEDLSQDILDQFEAIAAEAGISTVEALPAEGDFDNQIVMLVPQGVLYRWDEAELQWTTKVYAGVGPNTVTTDALVAGAVVTSKIAAGAVTSNEIDVEELSAISAKMGVLEVNNRLTILETGSLIASKPSPHSLNDGIFFGRYETNGGFALSASRTSLDGKTQSVVLSEENFQLMNATYLKSFNVVSPLVEVETSQTIPLPASMLLLDLELSGGGGGGRNQQSHTAGDGGPTTVVLMSGMTVVKTWVAQGGPGAATGNPWLELRGQPSEFYAPPNQVAEGWRGSGGGAGIFANVNGSGGMAGQQLSILGYDIAGLPNPSLQITIGYGGGGAGTGARNGGNGFVQFRTRNDSAVPADIVPLSPTAWGTFTSGASGTFPDLGSGLWTVHMGTTNSNLGLGQVSANNVGAIRINDIQTASFISSRTPTWTGGGSSRTIHYLFYSMGA